MAKKATPKKITKYAPFKFDSEEVESLTQDIERMGVLVNAAPSAAGLTTEQQDSLDDLRIAAYQLSVTVANWLEDTEKRT